jgi:nicotinamide riboside kinase
MEEKYERDMNHRFFVTGAESTGKSTLTSALAKHFSVRGVPEFARDYLEQLNRPYTYQDVEKIAQVQLSLIRQYQEEPLIFFDTCLINLKVWFREVYQQIPAWLEEAIPIDGQGTYILCEPDLPWEFDRLRENPHRREYLTLEYEKEIGFAGFDYFRVSGTGEQRLTLALDGVRTRLR